MLITLLVFFVFTACSMPTIAVTQNSVDLKLKDESIIKLDAQQVYKKRVKLSNINIYQNVLLIDNESYVVYERANATTGYKFTYGVNRNIYTIFPEYSSELINREGNLYFYKLKRNDETLYVIAQNLNQKGLDLLYGMHHSIFLKILNGSLKSQEQTKNILSEKNSPQSSDTIPAEMIKSGWNEKNIILDNIITRISYIKAVK